MGAPLELGTKIDWGSDQSHLLLNPQLGSQDQVELSALAKKFRQPSSVWIASSGSSKKANESLKLIGLSKAAFISSAMAVNEHLGSIQETGKKDVWIQALPRFHVGGLSIELRAELSGAKVVEGLVGTSTLSTGQAFPWQANKFIERAAESGATLSALVPTQIHDLVQTGLRAPSRLRAIVVGGATLNESLYFKARELGWPLLPSFGLTECCSQVATAEIKSLSENPLSNPFPRLRLLSHCQVELSAEGFLKILSPALFSGYAQKKDDRQQWHPNERGEWWTSSDKAEIHREKLGIYLNPKGRDFEFVKINGEGVLLSKLRENLSSLINSQWPSVETEFVLLDLNHERQGTELVLVHSEKASATLANEVLLQFNQRVISLEKLKRTIQVLAIPRSALGKIQWEELRRLSFKI